MISLSWFSGNSEPSRKFMVCVSLEGSRAGGRVSRRSVGSVGAVADDAGALHLSVARRVVHDRVVLRRAVVPERDAVLLPPEAHLELRDVGLAHEVAQELGRAGVGVLAEAHVGR